MAAAAADGAVDSSAEEVDLRGALRRKRALGGSGSELQSGPTGQASKRRSAWH